MFKKVVELAEGKDWTVSVGKRGEGKREVEFSRTSSAGQDFRFMIELEKDSIEDLSRKIKEYHDDFDVCSETFIWLGEDGHGKNGAPYDMRDILDDMEESKGKVYELYLEIDNLINT